MREIPLTQGKVALVDDEEFERLAGFKWRVMKTPYNYYAARGHDTLMHRSLLCAKAGQDVDHKNGNGLDNRRDNLRLCTRGQNNANTHKPTRNSLGYRGVNKNGRNFCAMIQVNLKRIYLGTFTSTEEAAREYDRAARTHFGEFAKLNFA